VAVVALARALIESGSLILLLSPSLRQSQELFRKVVEAWRALGNLTPLLAESALRYELDNGSRLIALPGTEPTIRGYSGVNLLVIDEAARVSDELYYAVRPMLAVSGGSAICLSTPWGKRGWFYQEWTSGEAWARTRVVAADCPRIPASFLAQERRTLPRLWFASEYDCEFVDTLDTVFAETFVYGAVTSSVQPLFGGSL
jgi:hypothetical protein